MQAEFEQNKSHKESIRQPLVILWRRACACERRTSVMNMDIYVCPRRIRTVRVRFLPDRARVPLRENNEES